MPRSNLYKKIERYGLTEGIGSDRPRDWDKDLAAIDKVIESWKATTPVPAQRRRARRRSSVGRAAAARAGGRR